MTVVTTIWLDPCLRTDVGFTNTRLLFCDLASLASLWWSNWRLYKNVKTAETVADWLHQPDWQLTQAQSPWPGPGGGSGVIMTNTGHCPDNPPWWDTGDCQGSLHCSIVHGHELLRSQVLMSHSMFTSDGHQCWTDVTPAVTHPSLSQHGDWDLSSATHGAHQMRTERRPPFD